MKIMISIAVLSGLLLGIAALSGVLAADKQADRPRCAECGMFADSSSTRVRAEIADKGQGKQSEFCSLGCLHTALETAGDKVALKSLEVTNYSTFGHQKRDGRQMPVEMLDGMTAWYLFGTKPLPGSMPPNIAAFGSKEGAGKFKGQLGGELLEGWEAVRAKLSKPEKVD